MKFRTLEHRLEGNAIRRVKRAARCIKVLNGTVDNWPTVDRVEVNSMSLSRAALVVSGLLIASMSLAGQGDKEMDAATARQKIIDLNKMWGKARVAFDKDTFEKTLAPDFYAEIDGKKQSRKDFIEEILRQNPDLKFLRFDVSVLTVQKNGDHWDAVIAEKLEAEGKGRDGKQHHLYSYWITRDGWKQQSGDNWQALYTTAAGYENWLDKKPPIDNWAS